jgi:hypothetical protein
METPQGSRSEKGLGLCCCGSISRDDQTIQTAMRDLAPTVRLETPCLRSARTRQAGNAADRPSRTTRNKSPRCMRAQHKGSPPQNHALRNGTAITDVSIRFLQHSSPDCIGLVSCTRPTDCRLSRSERGGDMPGLPSVRLSLTSVYRNCKKLAGTAPDEPPKSDLQLLPSRGSSLCGLKLRSSENHPLPDGLVGKARPLGRETSNKSGEFCSIM